MTVSLMHSAIHARRIFRDALGVDGSVGILLMDCTIDRQIEGQLVLIHGELKVPVARFRL